MPFKRPKHEGSYRFKHNNCIESAQPPTASPCIALKEVSHSEKDNSFSLPELESRSNFLASQIISEALTRVDGCKNIENSGFCGWSKVEKKAMASDTSFPKCEASKSRKMQRSVRGRFNASARWSSPPATRARQFTAQSVSKCHEKSKLVIHSHTDRFIKDYREGKLEKLRESRNVIIPARRLTGGVCSRSAESG
ncbi:unnamed protein product [Taenia asiatica]|uniref:Ovule protein n=1 Tax=Taenia asiatica TaxID=60517 RepID=A0A0R3WC24_TAEAS|nr:unnamed protein product [Taenia asiatica]